MVIKYVFCLTIFSLLTTNIYAQDIRNFVLQENIVINNHTPIGTADKPFTGNFYGNGRTITITSFAAGVTGDIGYFGVVDTGAVIRDVTIIYDANPNTTAYETVTITGPASEARFGGIAGTAKGNAQFLNVLVKGSATFNVTGANTVYTGGLVGRMVGTSRVNNAYGGLNLTVLKSNTSTTVSAYIGGIAGSMGDTTGAAVTVENVSAVGDITVGSSSVRFVTGNSSNGYGNHIGGITGYMYGAGDSDASRAVLKNSDYREGKIEIWIGNGTCFLGGAVGFLTSRANIFDCYSSPSVFTTDKTGNGLIAIGGFIGSFNSNPGTVSNCYTDVPLVKVTASPAVYAGGFAGILNADVSYCYAKANVEATSTNNNIRAGGFAGSMVTADASLCYAIGDVIAISNTSMIIYAGGFAGDARVLSNCYALGNVTATKNATGDISIGGLVGNIATGGSVSYCFAAGSVTSNREDTTGTTTTSITNAGGLVGDGGTRPISNSAALGASVTATGGVTRNVGRVYGSTSNTGKNNNRAFSGMRLFTSATYNDNTPSMETPTTGLTDHNTNNGAPVIDSDLRRRDIWQNSPPASGTPNYNHGLGFSATHWDFSTVDLRGRPILRGLGGQ